MKNPVKELILAIAFLAILLIPMIGLTQRKALAVEKPALESEAPVAVGELINTYVEVQCTSKPISIEISQPNHTKLEGQAPSCLFDYREKADYLEGEEPTCPVKGQEAALHFDQDELLLSFKIQFPEGSSAQALKIRVEPEGLRHREKLLWIDGSLSQEIKFSWK